MPQNVPSFEELLGSATHQALHLEMRDAYGVEDEAEEFDLWKRTGKRWEGAKAETYWRPWVDLIEATRARGVAVRRARIVSEPVTDYIRFEHEGTRWNLAAGEDVRWLPRRETLGIPLPGADFWLIDRRIVRFNHFTGDGAIAEPEASENQAVITLCESAFYAVWDRAYPHEQFKLWV